jgi:putative salt-induced outer membrane protein YdiY
MKKVILFIVGIFLINQLSAQIVNIENKRLSSKSEGFSGSVDLNLKLTYATKQLFQIGDKVKLAYAKKKHYLMFLTDHSMVKSNSEGEFINKGFEHLRYNFTFKDSGRVVYEAFHQGQFNKIQKINLRLLIGTGFRFKVVDKANFQLNLGTSIMGEYEELVIDEGAISQDILSSNYFSLDAQLTETFGINTITYFQPKFIDFGNYRLANETYLRFKFNKFLTFKIVYSLSHDSRNIEDVRKTNYSLSNTLSFTF